MHKKKQLIFDIKCSTKYLHKNLPIHIHRLNVGHYRLQTTMIVIFRYREELFGGVVYDSFIKSIFVNSQVTYAF